MTYNQYPNNATCPRCREENETDEVGYFDCFCGYDDTTECTYCPDRPDYYIDNEYICYACLREKLEELNEDNKPEENEVYKWCENNIIELESKDDPICKYIRKMFTEVDQAKSINVFKLLGDLFRP